jgi:hypothetical protein
MEKLVEFICELESQIHEYDLVNPNISKGSVGWHIEHSLLTLNLIIEAMNKSNPDNYKWTFDKRRSFVTLLGKIPRGKVKAPTVVLPTVDFNPDTLQQHISFSKEKIKSLEKLKPNNYFKHPFLGDFNLKPAKKFLEIHTKHHLNIIKDIIGSKVSQENHGRAVNPFYQR